MNIVLPAVKGVIMLGDSFLILRQKLPNGQTIWDLPGGKVEYGESPYNTLVREVYEETSLSVEIVKSLGFFWFFINNEKQIVCTTFICNLTDNNDVDISKNPAVENITEYRWVTKEDFLTDKYQVGHTSLKELIELI